MADRFTCVATHRLFPDMAERLANACHAILNPTDGSWPRQDVIDQCRNADAVIAFMPDLIDQAFLDACPRLKIVSAALKGYDNIDVDACTERGIWVSIVPDYLTGPTAELAIGLAIGLARHVQAGDADVRSGHFKAWRPTLYGTGFAGETVGCLGFGRIGQAIARRLQGFDVDLIFSDIRPVDPAITSALGANEVDIDELLERCRFLFVCTPLTSETTHLLNAAAVAHMRHDAFLINPARGSVVDEAAVAHALAEGRLAGYAADVFAFEDWARTDRPKAVPQALLFQSKKTHFTPHLGSATVAARRKIEQAAIENVLSVANRKPPPDAINQP
jgi:phosphonate dehydrogenase